MPLDVDWEGLIVAFENRSQKITHFFDRTTGDVVQVLDRDAQRHAALSGDPRFTALPKDSGERSLGDLQEFARQSEDAGCRGDLASALRAADPVTAFRDALRRHPKEEAHFFQFKERRARERALEWLKAQGIAR